MCIIRDLPPPPLDSITKSILTHSRELEKLGHFYRLSSGILDGPREGFKYFFPDFTRILVVKYGRVIGFFKNWSSNENFTFYLLVYSNRSIRYKNVILIVKNPVNDHILID